MGLALNHAREARRDPGYLVAVRKLPCALACAGGCSGRIDPHHAGARPGTSLKADDRTAVPLCRAHHDQWHDGNGWFAGMVKVARLAWRDVVIARTQAMLATASTDWIL